METQNDSYANQPLPVRSWSSQQTRHLPGKQPRGFERYEYQKRLLDQMPELPGSGGNPHRYEPVHTCAETLDCRCDEE